MHFELPTTVSCGKLQNLSTAGSNILVVVCLQKKMWGYILYERDWEFISFLFMLLFLLQLVILLYVKMMGLKISQQRKLYFYIRAERSSEFKSWHLRLIGFPRNNTSLRFERFLLIRVVKLSECARHASAEYVSNVRKPHDVSMPAERVFGHGARCQMHWKVRRLIFVCQPQSQYIAIQRMIVVGFV